MDVTGFQQSDSDIILLTSTTGFFSKFLWLNVIGFYFVFFLLVEKCWRFTGFSKSSLEPIFFEFQGLFTESNKLFAGYQLLLSFLRTVLGFYWVFYWVFFSMIFGGVAAVVD